MTEKRAAYAAGPPRLEVAFTVEGNPIPKERARVILRPGRRASAYTPDRTRAWEHEIAWMAGNVMGPRRPVAGPVELTLRIWRATAARADGDNIEKAVADACKGIIWQDDSQIVACHWTKAVDRNRPRVEIEVKEITEELQ